MGHAAGAKHKRRAKAAIAARNGEIIHEKKEQQKIEATANGQNGTSTTSHENDTPSKKEKENTKNKKKKKNKGIKWKKLAVTELKKSGGDMKFKILIKSLMSAAAASDGDEDADSDKIIKKLGKSKKFKIEGKTISLVVKA
jgi:hypothetical protein